ncbi:MAG: DUF3106 domain-containing protein [Verrucomicrobiota bacterium]|jgi:hypothetical protein
MRQPALPFAAALLLSAACFGQGESDSTNLPGPPPPPHWYQTVGAGVTLHHLSPVEYFRGLLGMTPAERERVLAGKSAEETKAVLDKVREYEALPRAVREARLHQTELHWRLLNLMRLDKAARAAELKQVSPLDQPMILGPLAQWDELPAATRKALLEKEDFIRTYLEWAARSPAGQKDMLDKLPAGRRARWAEQWERWQALPEEQRAGLCEQFRHFFTLTGREQQQTINAMSEAERRDMEQALRAFDRLPPADRQACIASFRKFAALTTEERNQFLRNAQRWEAMTAHERQLWRELVEKLPPMPPMPPGLPPFPPLPRE